MDTRFLGQFLILGLPSPELDRATQRVIQDLQPGGFILFSRNIENTRQVRKLTDTLRRLCTDEPILCIDEEGGRVSRLAGLDVATPAPASLAAAADPALITRHGRVIAGILRLLGMNMNLAPVLDASLGDDALDGTLRQRCWGADSQSIIANANVFLAELKKSGIQGCAKHFPTYTGARVDPHNDLPSLPGDLDSLLAGAVAPFLALAPELPAIMTAHVRLPGVPATGGKPASLSSAIITTFLRGQLGYDGMVITDDLDMGAIRGHQGVPEAAAEALLAGSDMAMVCHHPEESFAIREKFSRLPHGLLEDALLRIEKFRKQIPKAIAFREDRWQATLQEARDLVAELAEHALEPAGASASAPLSSPVENY